MGFLDKLEVIIDKGITLVDKVVSAGKAVYDEIKSWLGSSDAKESAKEINQLGDMLSKALGGKQAFDKDNASMQDMQNLQNELIEYKNRIAKEGETFESALRKIGVESISALAQSLGENGKDFTKQCEAEFDKIQGFVLKEISNKISLGNEKCVEILSLDSSADKKTKMQDFIAKTTQKAFRKMGDRFVESIENSVASMTKALQSKLEVRQTLANNQLATLEKIKEAKKCRAKAKRTSKFGFRAK
ncbi:hypothetical protein [Helicobacter sp. T3_23-1059]